MSTLARINGTSPTRCGETLIRRTGIDRFREAERARCRRRVGANAAGRIGAGPKPGNRVTFAADKGYDTSGFVKACCDINITPLEEVVDREAGY